MVVAVMGCVVNGPGESKNASIGISLPGDGEAPVAPVYADGEKIGTIKGQARDAHSICERFHGMIDEYVRMHYARKSE